MYKQRVHATDLECSCSRECHAYERKPEYTEKRKTAHLNDCISTHSAESSGDRPLKERTLKQNLVSLPASFGC